MAAAAGAEDEEGAMGDVVYAPAPTSAKWRRAWTAVGSARSDPTGTEDSNEILADGDLCRPLLGSVLSV